MLKIQSNLDISKTDISKKNLLYQRIKSGHISWSLKEIISQIDYYLVSLCSKTYVFEDKLIKY